MDRQQALELLQEIKGNVHSCCAITMEPDQVLVLLDKLQKYIEQDGNNTIN
jgi:hypothetical protein